MNFAKLLKTLLTTSGGCFFLSQDENIKIHYDNYMQKAHCVVVTKAYLQIFRTQSKIYDELFFEKLVNDEKLLTVFAKNPIVASDRVLNTPLYYLLAKVHTMSTKRYTKSFFL